MECNLNYLLKLYILSSLKYGVDVVLYSVNNFNAAKLIIYSSLRMNLLFKYSDEKWMKYKSIEFKSDGSKIKKSFIFKDK